MYFDGSSPRFPRRYDCGGGVFKATRGKNPVDLLQKFEDWLPEDGVSRMQCAFMAALVIDFHRSISTKSCTLYQVSCHVDLALSMYIRIVAAKVIATLGA